MRCPVSTYPQQVWSFCPRCGAREFKPSEAVRFPADELYCKACGFRYFINAGASVIALIERSPDELLMTRRLKDPAKGTLDLPGGFVDIRETAEQAVRREVLEECGLQVEQAQIVNRTYWNEYTYGGITYFTLDLVYICSIIHWEDLAADGKEVETVLLRRDEINPAEIGLDSVRRVTEDYLQYRL